MKKRLLATMLALCIIFIMSPVTALAAGDDSSLPEAVDGKITLNGNVTLDSEWLVNTDTALVLDLNGFTLSNNSVTTSGYFGTITLQSGSLTIEDSSEAQTGRVEGACFAVVVQGGTLTVNGGTFGKTSSAGYDWYEPLFVGGGSGIINGGTFVDGPLEYFEVYEPGSLVINGGRFDSMPYYPAGNQGAAILAPEPDHNYMAAYATYGDFAEANSDSFTYDSATNTLTLIGDYNGYVTKTGDWSGFFLNRDVTIDLNGHTWDMKTSSSFYPFPFSEMVTNSGTEITIQDSSGTDAGTLKNRTGNVLEVMGTLYFTGGTLEQVGGTIYGPTVQLDGNSTVIMTGGIVKGTQCAFKFKAVESGTPGPIRLSISGGTIETKAVDTNNRDDASCEISGGTFSSDVSQYVDASSGITKDSNDNWVVAPLTEENATASVGSKYYSSLSAAIANAKDGDTVTLLKNTNEDIVIPEGAELILDLKGHVLENSTSDTITNHGNLTITGNGTVKVSTSAKGALVNMVGGTITIQNATITRDGSGSWYVIKNHGTITIEDGATVNMPDHASSLIDNGWYGNESNDRDTYSGTNAVLIINGGTFSGGMNTVKNDDYGELVINGGSFSNTDGAVILNWNETTINNGTFTGATSYGVLANGYLNDSADKGQFVINGGIFTASESGTGALFSYPLGTGSNGVISVHNGTFTGTINYSYTLEISGGSFSQVIEQKYCADGFSPVSIPDSNGKYTVEVAENMTVKIMDANGNDVAAYETMDKALEKVTSGQTIALLGNINYDKKLSIPEGVTLDGDGYTITATADIAGGTFIEVMTDDVTIKDLTVNTVGYAKHGIQFYCTEGGELSGVTVNGGSYTSVIVNGSTDISIKNCTLNPDSGAYANIEYAMGSGVTTIPSVTVSNVKYDSDKPLVYVDNDTIKRMENVDAEGTLTDTHIADALGKVNKNVTISGMEMVLVDGSFVARPIPTPIDPDDGSSSSSSSTSVQRYDIEANAGRGGGISPDGRVRVRRGENQTFRITADDGYEIYDVKVDGESVGAVSRYTFENVRGDHTISVTFRQIGAQPEEPETPALPFTDVAESAWYYDAVAYCYENNIMDGTSSATFAPNMLLNRAMAAQVLYNLADGAASTAAGFPDVAATAWYANAVNWAAANGYVTGYDNGNFGPEDNLTREQLAVILYRYAGSPEPAGSLNGFVDAASASDYAVDALRWAVGEGLLTGKDGGRLDPTGTASRAELAQILARFAQM